MNLDCKPTYLKKKKMFYPTYCPRKSLKQVNRLIKRGTRKQNFRFHSRNVLKEAHSFGQDGGSFWQHRYLPTTKSCDCAFAHAFTDSVLLITPRSHNQ